MAPQAVKVRLRPGVGHSILPDNRSMKPGTDYVISYEDWRKISPKAKESVVVFKGNADAVTAKDGTDLTVNSTTIPTGKKLGQVVQGFGSDAYKLVKLVDGVNATAGMSATWVNYAQDKVTVDRVGGTALTPLVFAGVFGAAVTAGRYGWLQIDGLAPGAVVTTDVAAGDSVGMHPTTDGALRGSEQNERQTATLTGSPGGGTFTLTFGGQTTAGIAFDAAASAVRTALEALSNVDPGDVTVTGSAGGPYTIEFTGNLANADVAPLTASGAGLTGGTSPGVTIATVQAGGLQSGELVGTAATDASGGKADVEIRYPTTRLRHVRTGDFYRTP